MMFYSMTYFVYNFLEDTYNDNVLRNFKKYEFHELTLSTTPTDLLFPVAYSQPYHHHRNRTSRRDPLNVTFAMTYQGTPHSDMLHQEQQYQPQQQSSSSSTMPDDFGNSIVDSTGSLTSMFSIELPTDSRSSLSNSRNLELSCSSIRLDDVSSTTTSLNNG